MGTFSDMGAEAKNEFDCHFEIFEVYTVGSNSAVPRVRKAQATHEFNWSHDAWALCGKSWGQVALCNSKYASRASRSLHEALGSHVMSPRV